MRLSPVTAGILQGVVLILCSAFAWFLADMTSGQPVIPMVPILCAGTGLIIGETVSFGYPLWLVSNRKFRDAFTVVVMMISTLLAFMVAWVAVSVVLTRAA